MAYSIRSLMFWSISPPRWRSCFPDTGSVGGGPWIGATFPLGEIGAGTWRVFCCCSNAHKCLASVSHVMFKLAHLYMGPMYSSWWSLTCIQKHWIGIAWILWLVAEMRSNWLDRQYNCVLGSIYFSRSLIPSQDMVMEPSKILEFNQMYSTMRIVWYIPEILLL